MVGAGQAVQHTELKVIANYLASLPGDCRPWRNPSSAERRGPPTMADLPELAPGCAPPSRWTFPAIVGLIRELADFEHLTHLVEVTPESLAPHLFGARPVAEAVVAELDGPGVGFALFFSSFSTFLGKPSFYLEDLYVKPEFRSSGIGLQLLSEIARIAVERGCGRFEWSVLDWNVDAIRFYERMGATLLPEWRICRVSGEALRSFRPLSRSQRRHFSRSSAIGQKGRLNRPHRPRRRTRPSGTRTRAHDARSPAPILSCSPSGAFSPVACAPISRVEGWRAASWLARREASLWSRAPAGALSAACAEDAVALAAVGCAAACLGGGSARIVGGASRRAGLAAGGSRAGGACCAGGGAGGWFHTSIIGGWAGAGRVAGRRSSPCRGVSSSRCSAATGCGSGSRRRRRRRRAPDASPAASLLRACDMRGLHHGAGRAMHRFGCGRHGSALSAARSLEAWRWAWCLLRHAGLPQPQPCTASPSAA